eukprot:m.56631 g.56631  ORF g.56631 m.56631 type:complete len:287 (+) comp34615_c0_seq1:750-1610(+)
MEVAAIVNTMNPKVDSKNEDKHFGNLQRDLLWLLFDRGHLNKYPMALVTLAEYEEWDPSKGRQSAEDVLKLAVQLCRSDFENVLVYPHTSLGSCLYRQSRYKEALTCWRDGAEVVKRYKYSKGDEEIFKEFREIVTDFIPDMMVAVVSSQTDAFLNDPEVFALILVFFDQLCAWEELGLMPILNADWVKAFVSAVNKFHFDARKTAPFSKILEVQSETPHLSAVSSNAMNPWKLESEKMRGLRETLTQAQKINFSAVRLQLTALPQSRSRKRGVPTADSSQNKKFL